MEQATVRLDDLIGYVKSQEGTALERVSAAVRLGEHLGEVADHLIGHFVDQARRSGASWTEIGTSMGVTKQAVQKRFTSQNSEWDELMSSRSRFTERAKHALSAANEVAREHRHDYLGTEHLALGLLSMNESFAISAVEAAGISVDQAREAMEAALGPARVDHDPGPRVPLTRYAGKAMELTLREALRIGHNYVGTEHMLLGLLAEQDGRGGQVLRDLGLTTDGVEQWLLAELERVRKPRPKQD
ncbi:MAG TPA: Clp protease N-terminal domain-containing protein [Streptosporangiaceae bacterium]|jgi:hypothetical protein